TTTLRASNIRPNNNALDDHQPASAGTDAQSGATHLRMQPPDSSATNGQGPIHSLASETQRREHPPPDSRAQKRRHRRPHPQRAHTEVWREMKDCCPVKLPLTNDQGGSNGPSGLPLDLYDSHLELAWGCDPKVFLIMKRWLFIHRVTAMRTGHDFTKQWLLQTSTVMQVPDDDGYLSRLWDCYKGAGYFDSVK
ncbi:hypothetical protein LTR91_018717, partial [Friedmanniomyces endolithicus]